MRKINENQISNIFRLSSILYSEDNYTFSPRQLHQKVIENALFEMNIDEFTNLLNLSEFIEECYNFLFTDDEIWEIVSLPKLQNNTFIVYEAEKERYVNLSASRKQTIANKVTPPNINLFIEEFTAINNLPLKNSQTI